MNLKLIFMFIFLSFISLTPCSAQWNINWQGSGNWGPETEIGQLFDLKTVNQFHGFVEKVERVIPKKGMTYGVSLKLRNDKETFTVYLGPAWFIENQDMKILPRDEITMIGSLVIYNNQPVIVAGEITKDRMTLKLRNPNGYPLWCAWEKH